MSKRWLAAFLLLQVALAAAGWGFSAWVTARRVREIVAASGSVHRLGAAEPPSSSDFANMRAKGKFLVTDPKYGARCDGSTDDSASMLAANADAVSAGGVTVVPSINGSGAQSVCGVSSQLAFSGPVNWSGDATNFNTGPIIRALSSVRSVISVRTTAGSLNPSSPPGSQFTGLRIDCNNLCTRAGILRIGDYGTRYDNVYVSNSPVDGWAGAGRPLPLVLGAITTGGGAPGGVTLSQPDPNSGFGSNLQVGTFHWIVKTTAGALGTATFVLSQDNGATYATASQIVQSSVNLVVTSAASYLYQSGIVISFPSQTYASNGTYAFDVTVQNADDGDTAALNTNPIFIHSGGFQNGTTYETSGSTAAGNWPGGNTTLQIVSGTVSLVSGSQIVQGSGTSFKSVIGAVEGDMISVAGVAYPIASVLDDLQLAIVLTSVPTVNLSGQDYSISHGADYWEDGATENNSAILLGFRAANSVRGVRVGGLHGIKTYGLSITDASFHLTALVGSSQGTTEASNFDGSDFEGSSTAYVESGCLGANFNGFSHTTPFPLGPGPYVTQAAGELVGVNGANANIPMSTVSYNNTTQIIVAGTSQITAPDMGRNSGSGHTSNLLLNPLGVFTMTSSPTITSPSPNVAVRIRLTNTSFNPITLQTDALASTGLALSAPYVTLGRGDSVEFVWLPSFSLWMQDGAVTSIYSSNGAGNYGPGSRVVVTTTNASTELWRSDTQNSGISPGTGLTFDVLAMARGGVDYARWTNCHADWDVAGNLLGFTVGLRVDSGGNASTWTMTANNATPFAKVLVTGDNSANQVEWKINVWPMSPPNFSVAGGLRGRVPWLLVPVAGYWLRKRRAANDTKRRAA
jgi:hypothetical protein